MKLFWKCAFVIFRALREALEKLEEKALDCQRFCDERTGDDPF